MAHTFEIFESKSNYICYEVDGVQFDVTGEFDSDNNTGELIHRHECNDGEIIELRWFV